MIAQFWFSSAPPKSHVILHLAWVDDEPLGRIAPPADAIAQLQLLGVSVRPDDEYLQLPMALSFGVLAAGLSGRPLTVTGDLDAWPRAWGRLKERQDPPPQLATVRTR